MDLREQEELAAHWTAAQPSVAAFLRTLIPDPHQSQDVLQEVAVVLVRKFAQYDRARPFTAWAIGVAKHEFLAWRRRQTNDPHLFDDVMVDRIAVIYQHNLAQGGSDLRNALELCVEKLVGRAQKVIQLHYWQGMKSFQITREMNIGHGAVRMILSRSRQALRACIEQQLGRSLQLP